MRGGLGTLIHLLARGELDFVAFTTFVIFGESVIPCDAAARIEAG